MDAVDTTLLVDEIVHQEEEFRSKPGPLRVLPNRLLLRPYLLVDGDKLVAQVIGGQRGRLLRQKLADLHESLGVGRVRKQEVLVVESRRGIDPHDPLAAGERPSGFRTEVAGVDTDERGSGHRLMLPRTRDLEKRSGVPVRHILITSRAAADKENEGRQERRNRRRDASP